MGAGDRADAYCGGIDLNVTTDKRLRNVQGYLDQGFNAVKIKVGRDHLRQDVERVQAVRALIGPDTRFVVDTNYSMTVTQAIAPRAPGIGVSFNWDDLRAHRVPG